MARSDDDTWDLATSVGATATGVAVGRAVASRAPDALINDPFAEPLVRAVGVDFFSRLASGELDPDVADGVPQRRSGAAGRLLDRQALFRRRRRRSNSVAWVSNIRAHPNVAVEIGSDPSKAVVAHELPRDERDRIYAIVVQRARDSPTTRSRPTGSSPSSS